MPFWDQVFIEVRQCKPRSDFERVGVFVDYNVIRSSQRDV
jgi:hypothetical protein